MKDHAFRNGSLESALNRKRRERCFKCREEVVAWVCPHPKCVHFPVELACQNCHIHSEARGLAPLDHDARTASARHDEDNPGYAALDRAYGDPT